MATDKKKSPVLPKARVKEGEVPQFASPPSGKYDIRISDGDLVEVPLDKHGMPVMVIPQRKRKDK